MTESNIHSIENTLIRLEERISHIQDDIKIIKVEYVRLERYMHVERVVLGLSAAIALGLIGLVVPKLFGGG